MGTGYFEPCRRSFSLVPDEILGKVYRRVGSAVIDIKMALFWVRLGALLIPGSGSLAGSFVERPVVWYGLADFGVPCW